MTRFLFVSAFACFLSFGFLPLSAAAQQDRQEIYAADAYARLEPQSGEAQPVWDRNVELSDQWALHLDGGLQKKQDLAPGHFRDVRNFPAEGEKPPLYFAVGVGYSF